MLRVAILGATGRMGQTLIRLLADTDDLVLSGAVTEPGHAALGRDAAANAGLPGAGVMLVDDPDTALAGCAVAIDFTLPAATAANAAACARCGVALVMGTTGLGPAEEQVLDKVSSKIPVVYGRNMSVGVNLLTELVRTAARTLGVDYDIEITEAHHRRKVDAPSGTALQLGEAAAAGRGRDFGEVARYARHGKTGERDSGSIGFAVIRAGNIVGDHSVMFAADEEIIELGHRALDRAVFARGALRAARWAAGRAPGRYSMRDVLNLGD